MRIKDWGRFQHYKSGNRDPQWIKLYRQLLDDIDWHTLDGESAKFLVMLWLLASEADGELPGTAEIAFRLRIPEKQVKTTISKLDHWLEQSASKPLATGYQNACLEEEEEEEEEQEEEKEKEKEGEGRRKRRTPIPPDFQLTEEMRSYALGKLPDMDTASTFADFKDHHTNKGTLGLDWQAGWRTWVNNCVKGFKYAKAKRREQRGGNEQEIINPWEWAERQRLAALARRKQQNGSDPAHGGMEPGTSADAGGDGAEVQAVTTGRA